MEGATRHMKHPNALTTVKVETNTLTLSGGGIMISARCALHWLYCVAVSFKVMFVVGL